MDTVSPASRSGNQARSPSVNNGLSTPRPRIACERDPIHNETPRITEENRCPSGIPTSFQGMLKTTTETGNIGMFSIKPSRVPQVLNSPRSNSMAHSEKPHKQRRNFQAYGVPIVDDRRRLPSYAREATSEVIAMYESPAQRPGKRLLADSEHRSYSMTQASSYTLSNHRSFASLRSQQEGSALLQRPRSPFAYPTRLRRPGVRPSSPALTDGGLVDYSRRAEIERLPLGFGNNASSPGSLYAQKRRPPGPYYQRSEANRSTPSLLSQHSPQRHSSNPNLRQSVGSQNDWPRRPVLHSGNTSPARSSRSLASTVNLYAAAGPASTTTIPGKLQPPSPLYYDYTEEFDIDDYNEPEPLPPPKYGIGHSIPERSSINTGTQSISTAVTSESGVPVPTIRPTIRNSISATSVRQRSFKSTTSSRGTQKSNDSVSSPVDEEQGPPVDEVGIKPMECKRETKIIRLSGLGFSARELSTHVEEASGLPSSPSFEVPASDEFEDAQETLGNVDDEPSVLHPGLDALSMRSSAYSLSTNLKQFPRPPGRSSSLTPLNVVNTESDIGAGTTESCLPRARSTQSQCSHHGQTPQVDCSLGETHHLTRRYSREIKRTSIVESLDMGFEELDRLIIPPFSGKIIFRATEGGMSDAPIANTDNMSTACPELPQRKLHPSVHSQVRARYNGTQSEGFVALTPSQTQTQMYEAEQQYESISAPKGLKLGIVPNFSQCVPGQLMKRPESPMIAPKPISPARQLRLRNSIPQIMKALPPLPPEPPVRAGVLMNRLPSFEPEHQLLPKETEALTLWREPQKSPNLPGKPAGNDTEKTERSERPLVLLQEENKPIPDQILLSAGIAKLAPSLPRLKLKTRTLTMRPTSPPNTQPWNMAESYPWSSQVELPPLSSLEEPPVSALPKFRLKVTRASNSSQGTMIINRDSSDSRGMNGVHIRSPKDLFTPPTGVDNIFRQVGKHLHSRASENVNRSETELSLLSCPAVREQIVIQKEDVMKSESSQKQVVPMTPIGAQSSFSDDSSHFDDRHKLRTRLSNLRARIPFHYGYRATARSSDDGLWECRGDDLPSHVLRSAPNLHSHRATFFVRPQRKVSDKVRLGGLRGKVRGWLKGAKTAITGHRRTRSSLSKKSDDERIQLTPFD